MGGQDGVVVNGGPGGPEWGVGARVQESVEGWGYVSTVRGVHYQGAVERFAELELGVHYRGREVYPMCAAVRGRARVGDGRG